MSKSEGDISKYHHVLRLRGKEFSTLIKRACSRMFGYTQREVAKALKISPAGLTNYQRGRYYPRNGTKSFMLVYRVIESVLNVSEVVDNRFKFINKEKDKELFEAVRLYDQGAMVELEILLDDDEKDTKEKWKESRRIKNLPIPPRGIFKKGESGRSENEKDSESEIESEVEKQKRRSNEAIGFSISEEELRVKAGIKERESIENYDKRLRNKFWDDLVVSREEAEKKPERGA